MIDLENHENLRSFYERLAGRILKHISEGSWVYHGLWTMDYGLFAMTDTP